MNQELRALFVADQSEPRADIGPDNPEYWQMRERDAQRRSRVNELLAQGLIQAPPMPNGLPITSPLSRSSSSKLSAILKMEDLA